MAEKDDQPDSKRSNDSLKKTYASPAWEVEEIIVRAQVTCNKEGFPSCEPGPIQS